MLGQIYRTHRVSVKREKIESIGPDLLFIIIFIIFITTRKNRVEKTMNTKLEKSS
jgi:hypothetical protein